jgi:hypothetical protein
MLILVTFLLTTAFNGALLVYAARKLTAYLQRNADARQEVVEHVLIPLFGRKPEVHAKEEKQPAQGKDDAAK